MRMLGKFMICLVLSLAAFQSGAREVVDRGTVTSQLGAGLAVCEDVAAICRAGKKIVLNGINVPTVIFAKTRWGWGTVDHFAKQVDLAKSWGGNFIIIGFDPVRSADPDYVNTILDAAEYAKNAGMFVELIQHHVGADLNADNDRVKLGNEVPMEDVGPDYLTNISLSWASFLSHPGVVQRVLKTVDIFGLFSEPALYLQADKRTGEKRQTNVTWTQWRPRAERVCTEIRRVLKRSPICSVSGVNWGWEVSGMIADPIRLPNVIAEVHQYKWHDDKGESWGANVGVVLGKVPVLVGEFGYRDPPEYVGALLSLMQRHQISWAAWPGPYRSWVDNYEKFKAPYAMTIRDAMNGRRGADATGQGRQ